MPLDDRIRHLIREETTPSGSTPNTEQLQQQITDLHEHLHLAASHIAHLEQRVEELEKPAAPEEPAAMRTAPRRATPRKSADA